MNFLQKSRPRNENRPKIILVVVLFCVLFLISFLFPQGIKNIFYFSAKPIWASRDLVVDSFKSVVGFFQSKSGLINKNLLLEDELASLKLKEIDYDILLKENEELKSLVGRSGVSDRVISRVLSKPPRSPYDTFVIDAGSAQGITKDDKVYISGNIIIGLITDVTPHTSVVTFFSGGNQRQESVVLRTGTSFEISGKGGGNFQVEVPKDTDIIWGDVFEYPGLTASVMGSVYYIDSNSQSSFKTIFIRVPGNVFDAKWVFVEKN